MGFITLFLLFIIVYFTLLSICVFFVRSMGWLGKVKTMHCVMCGCPTGYYKVNKNFMYDLLDIFFMGMIDMPAQYYNTEMKKISLSELPIHRCDRHGE